MKLFEVYVPRNEHWYAKDLSILIYNKTRSKYPKLTNAQYEARLARTVRKRYKEAEGTKTLVEVLKEMWQEVKKEDN